MLRQTLPSLRRAWADSRELQAQMAQGRGRPGPDEGLSGQLTVASHDPWGAGRSRLRF